MSEAKINMWTVEIGRTGATQTPKLASLPPTTEVFSENMLRRQFVDLHLEKCTAISSPEVGATHRLWMDKRESIKVTAANNSTCRCSSHCALC